MHDWRLMDYDIIGKNNFFNFNLSHATKYDLDSSYTNKKRCTNDV